MRFIRGPIFLCTTTYRIFIANLKNTIGIISDFYGIDYSKSIEAILQQSALYKCVSV
jgi:hypothetical protein